MELPKAMQEMMASPEGMKADREEILARTEDGQMEMKAQVGSLITRIDTIQEELDAEMNIHQEKMETAVPTEIITKGWVGDKPHLIIVRPYATIIRPEIAAG